MTVGMVDPKASYMGARAGAQEHLPHLGLFTTVGGSWQQSSQRWPEGGGQPGLGGFQSSGGPLNPAHPQAQVGGVPRGGVPHTTKWTSCAPPTWTLLSPDWAPQFAHDSPEGQGPGLRQGPRPEAGAQASLSPPGLVAPAGRRAGSAHTVASAALSELFARCS